MKEELPPGTLLHINPAGGVMNTYQEPTHVFDDHIRFSTLDIPDHVVCRGLPTFVVSRVAVKAMTCITILLCPGAVGWTFGIDLRSRIVCT